MADAEAATANKRPGKAPANQHNKRLTYVVNYLSADDAQHYAHIPNLLAEMEKLGWEIDLVSERGGTGKSNVLGMPVTFLSTNSRWKRLIPLAAHLMKGGANGRVVFVRISKSAGFVAALLGRLFGWKTVYWLSDVKEDFNARKKWAKLRFGGMRLLLNLVERLATGPESMVDYYAKTYDLPDRKVVLLYNDINISNISPANDTKCSKIATVLLVHHLSPARETMRYVPTLLRKLRSYAKSAEKSVVLEICGDGPERKLLERMASNETSDLIRVQFHGAVPQQQLASFYERATIFIMPSYREGFPRVIIEAMARGLPIVATDAGGTRDICGPLQQEFIVDRDDADAFGDAVERLLASPFERKRLSDENLARVRRFGTPEVARMYDRALSDLIGAAPAA